VTGHVFEVTNLAFAFTRNLRFKAVYLELAAGIWDSGQFARVSLSEFSPFTASLYYTITGKILKKRDNGANSETANAAILLKLARQLQGKVL
jgi:hypothetical protein